MKDIITMQDAELKSFWNEQHAASEAAYQRLTELSATEAEFNRREYLVLARTTEGRAKYDAQIASFRASADAIRNEFNKACSAKDDITIEMQRRGML